MRLVLFLLSVSAFADSLALKDGRVLSGTYLGGSTPALRFLVGDRVETYPIVSVDRIRFDDPGPASAPAPTHFPRPTTVERRTSLTLSQLPTLPISSSAFARFCRAIANRSCATPTNRTPFVAPRCGKRSRSIGRTSLSLSWAPREGLTIEVAPFDSMWKGNGPAAIVKPAASILLEATLCRLRSNVDPE